MRTDPDTPIIIKVIRLVAAVVMIYVAYLFFSYVLNRFEGREANSFCHSLSNGVSVSEVKSQAKTSNLRFQVVGELGEPTLILEFYDNQTPGYKCRVTFEDGYSSKTQSITPD